MNRLLAVLVAVLLAASLVYVLQSGDDGEDGGAYVDEIAALIRVGKVADARTEFERMRGDLSDEDAFFAEGMVLVGEEDYAGAEVPLREAVGHRPDDATVLDFYVAALLNQGKADEAVPISEAFVARHPDDALGAWALARSLADPALPQRDLSRALSLLDDVHRLQTAAGDGVPEEQRVPRAFQVERLRATAASDLGRHYEAVEAGRRYAALQQDAWYAWALYGAVARKAAFAVNPAAPDPTYVKFAAAAYGEALKRGPPEDQLPMLYLDFVQLLLTLPDQGAVSVAVENAARLRELYPGRIDFQILYARALVRTDEEGLMDEAAQVYEQVLEQEPENLTALRNLALVYYDWKLGGQRGTYLQRAHELLRKYERLGGVVDGSLRDTIETLARMAEGDSAATGIADGFRLLRRAERAPDPGPLLKKSVELFRAALAKDPDQAAVWRGLLRALSGLLPDSEDELLAGSREAIERFPEDPGLRLSRAEALLVGLRPTDESNALGKLTARQESSLRALVELAAGESAGPAERQMVVMGVALAGGTRLRSAIDALVPRASTLVADLWKHVAEVEASARGPAQDTETPDRSE